MIIGYLSMNMKSQAQILFTKKYISKLNNRSNKISPDKDFNITNSINFNNKYYILILSTRK